MGAEMGILIKDWSSATASVLDWLARGQSVILVSDDLRQGYLALDQIHDAVLHSFPDAVNNSHYIDIDRVLSVKLRGTFGVGAKCIRGETSAIVLAPEIDGNTRFRWLIEEAAKINGQIGYAQAAE